MRRCESEALRRALATGSGTEAMGWIQEAMSWRAKRFDRLSFDRVLTEKLSVMDATAIVMCRDNNLPLIVFDLNRAGDLVRLVAGETVGTTVGN